MDTAQSGQRPLAAAFTLVLAVAAASLWTFAPSLISGYRADAAFYESSALFPRTALAIVTIAALIHWVRILRGIQLLAGEDLDEIDADWRRVAGSFVIFALYTVFVPWVGYTASTALFVICAARYSRLEWRSAIAMSFALTAALYGVFVWALNVWFATPKLLAA